MLRKSKTVLWSSCWLSAMSWASLVGCGGDDQASSPIMVDAQHSHYYVHAPEVTHDHTHPDAAAGGHAHSHQHSD